MQGLTSSMNKNKERDSLCLHSQLCKSNERRSVAWILTLVRSTRRSSWATTRMPRLLVPPLLPLQVAVPFSSRAIEPTIGTKVPLQSSAENGVQLAVPGLGEHFPRSCAHADMPSNHFWVSSNSTDKPRQSRGTLQRLRGATTVQPSPWLSRRVFP